jgi:protein-L-isoaspartate(D-aspartate) O-methyltransferase
VVWADGLDFDPGETRFDRILVHALVEAHMSNLTRALAPGGALVAAMADEAAGEQRIVRLASDGAGEITASAHGPARTFTPLAPGLALAL